MGELLWLKIIKDLKIKWDGPMRLYCDNKFATNIAYNPIQHDQRKHIEVDRHFIKEKLESGLICTPYASAQSQLADVLTKGLSGSVFECCIQAGNKECLFTSLRGRVGKHWQWLGAAAGLEAAAARFLAVVGHYSAIILDLS